MGPGEAEHRTPILGRVVAVEREDLNGDGAGSFFGGMRARKLCEGVEGPLGVSARRGQGFVELHRHTIGLVEYPGGELSNVSLARCKRSQPAHCIDLDTQLPSRVAAYVAGDALGQLRTLARARNRSSVRPCVGRLAAPFGCRSALRHLARRRAAPLIGRFSRSTARGGCIRARPLRRAPDEARESQKDPGVTMRARRRRGMRDQSELLRSETVRQWQNRLREGGHDDQRPGRRALETTSLCMAAFESHAETLTRPRGLRGSTRTHAYAGGLTAADTGLWSRHREAV
jgi:hypothetical protein